MGNLVFWPGGVKMMTTKRFFLSLVVVAFLVAMVTALAAKEKDKDKENKGSRPAARLTMHITKVAVGVGYSWGEGTLRFRGKSYKFKVKGLNAIGVGVSAIDAKGEVYNLEDLDDFPGKYVGTGEGAALILGPAGLVMKNYHGVVINLKAEQKGVNLELGDQGLSITEAWD
jgi:hypothetical protein